VHKHVWQKQVVMQQQMPDMADYQQASAHGNKR
jgi:hypothetical protein